MHLAVRTVPDVASLIRAAILQVQVVPQENLCPRNEPGQHRVDAFLGSWGEDRMDIVTLVFDRLLPVAVVLCVLCAAVSLIILLI